MFIPALLFAQNVETSITTIDIHVNVLTQININQTRNMQLTINADSINQININPQQDVEAGSFEAVGTGSAPVKISFPDILELKQLNGNHKIKFHIKVSSNTQKDQSSSLLLEKNSIDVKLNRNGQRYFWVGGKANIKNVPGGKYIGTMSFNLDYD